MGVSERFPVSLNAVNVVCFKIDWQEKMLNVLLVKEVFLHIKIHGHFLVVSFKVMKR
jgi:hypothetical protein